MRIPAVLLLGLCLAACTIPVPPVGEHHPAPPDYLGLRVDSDLLETSRLDEEDKRAAQELLRSYYSTEYSLRAYADALEKNLGANEQLIKDYSTTDAIVGGVAGLSSIGVIFSTAAIAAPIAGVVWIGASQYIQHYEVEPQIKQAGHRLAEAEGLLKLFPDVEKIFDGLAFAETYEEARRRFTKWALYVKNLEARAARFFAKTADDTSPPAPPHPAPSPKP